MDSKNTQRDRGKRKTKAVVTTAKEFSWVFGVYKRRHSAVQHFSLKSIFSFSSFSPSWTRTLATRQEKKWETTIPCVECHHEAKADKHHL
jgi:predicted secreted Zn-dependent protease